MWKLIVYPFLLRSATKLKSQECGLTLAPVSMILSLTLFLLVLLQIFLQVDTVAQEGQKQT